MSDKQFTIPIVLFIFRRESGLKKIISQIRKIKPQKIYIIGDGPRNEKETEEVNRCRTLVEKLIDWDCKIIKNYAVENRGVYRNIGEGARWVFSKEEEAIFLEDDNFPEITFFYYCEEMLKKYKNDKKILWVCGTNYMGKYETEYSYMFTQHLLPCGWASWKDKFLKYYDGNLKTWGDIKKQETFKKNYRSKALYKQQLYSIGRTKYLLETNKSKSSWDYQMLFSIKSNNLYGISPKYNLIKNIGVDAISEHGGNSWKLTMTKRFCGMNSYPLEFPLKHPKSISLDKEYEKKVDKIVTLPIRDQFKQKIAKIVKKILGLNQYDSMSEFIRNKV